MERIRLEIKRQPFHILLGLVLIALINNDLLNPAWLGVAIIFAILGSVYVRKTKPRFFYGILEHIERPNALENFPGKGFIFFLFGTMMVTMLFEKDIAMAAVMVLSFGDSFSRLIGPFGRIKHPFNDTRFLEGVMAGFVAAALAAMLFVKPAEAIAASFFAMVIEGLDMKMMGYKIDDNVVIPVLAGAVIWLIRLV